MDDRVHLRILGTAGHIDHGKTALVEALTGIDTDRLREEKERGITIELGFAELPAAPDVRYGVVDVPGHEGFIRTMLAGATGMDVVLLVVAADEGVMPQTREHLDIVRLLGVPRLVVALTKADLVAGEWLELVTEEVRELLSEGPYEGAPLVTVSARTGRGLDDLRRVLAEEGRGGRDREPDDVVRLPIDRVFTVHGTGTVVTGTLWSGRLRVGDRVRLLPGDRPGRVRGLQVHGLEVEEATAGQRTAVAVAGEAGERGEVERGGVLVTGDAWRSTTMLTAWLEVVGDTSWSLATGQRVRVHLGTEEVMARLVLLGTPELHAGQRGWAQLRLEAPLVARGRDALVLRSYSPVTTIAGGRVAEPWPPKRTRLDDGTRGALERVLEGAPDDASRSAVALRRWEGSSFDGLVVLTGLPPARVPGPRDDGPRFDEQVLERARVRIAEAVEGWHADRPLEPGMPVDLLTRVLPEAHPVLLERATASLAADGTLRVERGAAALTSFSPTLDRGQKEALAALRELYDGAGLAPPPLREIPANIRERDDFRSLLRLLEEAGELVALGDEHYVAPRFLEEAARSVARHLGGRTGLGPTDFREVLPLSRKHLLPVLLHLDGLGITLRQGDTRDVRPPDGPVS